jgi:hypothetical protein
MSKKPKTTNPPWITSRPGRHPAFRNPTKAEIDEARKVHREAAELSGSPGRSEADEKQLWLADAEFRERTNRDQLALARKMKRKPEIFIYRSALAMALRDLGRFEEAIAEITTPKGKAFKGCQELRKEIEWYRLAVYRDDNYECGCARPVATIPDPTRQSAVVEIEIRRRHRIGFCFSYKHNQDVEVWK